jgi:hypothetical protein
VYCWACVTQLPKAANFCPRCGASLAHDDPNESYGSGWDAPIQTQTPEHPYASRPLASIPPAPLAPEPVREQQRGFSLRREGPIGRLVSLLSLPAGIAAIYLAATLWGDNRDAALRVLGALALVVLSPLPVGLVIVPVSLLFGLLLRGASDRTRGGVAAFWSSVSDGISNVLSLAAIAYIFMQLWETFQ